MVLKRDAPVELDVTSLAVRPNDAEVKRLFDFLEFRALYDRMYEALGLIGAAGGGAPMSSSQEVLEAEVTDVATPAEAAYSPSRHRR